MKHINFRIIWIILLTFFSLLLLAGSVSYSMIDSEDQNGLFQAEIDEDLLIIGLCLPLFAALLLVPVIQARMKLTNNSSMIDYNQVRNDNDEIEK